MSLGETLEAVIGEAINQAVGEHEGGIATKWIALVDPSTKTATAAYGR